MGGLGRLPNPAAGCKKGRQHLAGMPGIGPWAGHRGIRVLGHTVEVRLVVQAGDDPVEVAVQDPSDVPHRLPLAELDLVAEYRDGVAAELLDGDLERHPGTVAGPLEDHPQALALQGPRSLPASC